MLRFWKWTVLSFGLVASLLVLSAVAADDDKEAKQSGDKPEAKAEETAVDLDKVPDGTNEELLTYIKKVMGTQPKSMDDLMKMSKAIGTAADKILDANPSDQELRTVLMIRMRLPMGPDECKAYAEKLTKIGEDLTKAGKTDLGREVASMSYVVKLNGAGDDPEAFKKAIGDAIKYLGEGNLQKGDLVLVMNVAQATEMMEDQKFAGETLEKIVGLLKDSKLENVEKMLKRLEGTLRRMKLVGNKIELEGNLLSGDKLDLSKYDGKVLLVDFWATWCGPCVGEIPNMKKNYEAYHDKGFEIVGLSCDQDKETVEKFVKEREIPWGIVYGDTAPSPSFDYYGISGIPTMILVGKDGKVISTSARGEALDKLLEEQFGPAEKKVEKKTDKNGATTIELPGLKKATKKNDK
jgi:thiol-disulfide isomerase/thioredoxin